MIIYGRSCSPCRDVSPQSQPATTPPARQVYWPVRTPAVPRKHGASSIMADTFDPYREALVMETETDWSGVGDAAPTEQRPQLAAKLHAAPGEAAQLEYVRTHTGFCRRIVVTPDDLARIGA